MEFLESVKNTTKSILSEIPKDELKVITLPILREKLANVMGLAVEELMGKEIKLAIMEKFQDYLQDYSDIKEESTEIEKKSEKKKTKAYKKISVKDKSKSALKAENFKSTNTSKSSEASVKSAQIEKLKSYVFKCGVRKVWKKELDGLDEGECIVKIQRILKELGIEGKPSIEQCKAIKARREFESELREIDTSNIIEGKRRRSIDSFESIKKKLIIESDSEEDDCNEAAFDLKALGDSESDD